jgi:hypothetical protein
MPIRRQPFIALPTSFRKHSASWRRPLLQRATSLPDRQPHPWSLLDEVLEDALCLSEAIPSEHHFLNPLPIPAPLLDLVQVAPGRRRAGRRFLLGTSRYRLIGGHRSICQTAQRLAGQHLLTIGRTRKFFALLYFRLFNGCGAKRTRSHKVGIKPNGTASNRDNLSESSLISGVKNTGSAETGLIGSNKDP